VKRTADTKHNLTRSRREREREKVKRKLEDAERAAAAAALANASRVVGLRRLRAANNRLKRLPPCLGATLAVGGAGGRVVDVRGNPLEPPVRSLLAEPGGVDAYIDRLASTHSETARVSPAPPRRALEDAEAVAETLEALTNDEAIHGTATRGQYRNARHDDVFKARFRRFTRGTGADVAYRGGFP